MSVSNSMVIGTRAEKEGIENGQLPAVPCREQHSSTLEPGNSNCSAGTFPNTTFPLTQVLSLSQPNPLFFPMHSTTSSRMSFWTFFVLAFSSLAAAASGVWTFEDAQAVVAAKGGKADAYK